MPDMNCWSLFPSYISWYLPFLSHFFKIWGLAAWIGYFQYIFFLNEILGSNFHLDNQIKNIIDSKVATNIQSVWKTALYFNVVAWLGWAVNMAELSSAEQCWVVLSMATRGEDDPSTPTGGWFPAKPVSNPFHSERSRFCAKKDARLLKSSAFQMVCGTFHQNLSPLLETFVKNAVSRRVWRKIFWQRDAAPTEL